MSTNTFVGPSGSKWNERENWDRNNGNYNCPCVIQNATGLPFFVYHDVADGSPGQIGFLILVDANLHLTNIAETGEGSLVLGGVSLYGASTINVGPGWTLQSGQVRINDQSKIVVDPTSNWNTGATGVIVQGKGTLHLRSAVLTNFIESAMLSGATLSSGQPTIGTSATALALGQVTTPHWAFFHNLDPTNFVRIRNGASGADFAQFYPDEAAFIPLATNCVPYAIADTAECVIEFMIVGQNSAPPPYEIPDAPTGVVAVSVPPTPPALQILVTWEAVEGATTYSLYRGATSGSQGDTPYQTDITDLFFADFMSSGLTKWYEVTAVNLAGESAKSAEVTAST